MSGEPTGDLDPGNEVERLRSRVERLEQALQERSRELRSILRHVSHHDALVIGRILAGLPPLPISVYEPELWQETTELTHADVEEVLEDLWTTLAAEGALVER